MTHIVARKGLPSYTPGEMQLGPLKNGFPDLDPHEPLEYVDGVFKLSNVRMMRTDGPYVVSKVKCEFGTVMILHTP